MKKQNLISALLLTGFLASCGSSPASSSSSSHDVHSLEHYLSKEPTCSKSGNKEYWYCTQCEQHFLSKPQGESTDKGEPSGYFEPNDDRYVAPDPSKHSLNYAYGTAASYSKDGVKGHYECRECHALFDEFKKERSQEYFTLRKGSAEHPAIFDEVLAEDAVTSSWDAIKNNVSKWIHTPGSPSLTIPNNAGWQLSRSRFSDLDFKVKVEGASKQNPDGASGWCTKSIIIGGSVNPNELHPGEGVYGRYPVGYLINVSNGTSGGTKGIQIYEWTEDKVDSVSGFTKIGGAVGDYDSTLFRVKVSGQTLSLFDANGKVIYLDMAGNSNYHMTTLDLDHYRGGSIGLHSWTTGSGSEPDKTTFTISEFSGKRMEDEENAVGVAEDIIGGEHSIASTNQDIALNAAKWTHQSSKYETIDVSGSFDSAKNIGSWQLAEDYYQNFQMDFSISGAGKTSPFLEDGASSKAFLFGAESSGEYFKGYSINVYDDRNNDKWLSVHYHDGSAKGKLIGGLYGTFDGKKLTMRVQNRRLFVYDNGTELFGGSYWGKRNEGLLLDKYEGGRLGIINWDDVRSVFAIHGLRDLNSLSSSDYAKQDASKRVSVFLLAGQSNMEGNTRAWDNESSKNYLRTYCNQSEHDYAELVGGYKSVQTSLHLNYVPQTGTCNYSNKADPMAGAFLDTKVGMGLTRTDAPSFTYVGPEIGAAERLSSHATSEQPIFFIKYASGGTTFANNVLNWRSHSSLPTEGYLYKNFLQFAHNCLRLIIDQGFVPVVKGIMWHQGESDGTSESAANNYKRYLTNFSYDLKNDLSSFAIDNDARNIAFLDAHVNKDCSTLVTYPDIINGAKNDVAALSDKNFVIDTNSGGLDLKVGTISYGGGDGWHYTIDSQLKLGNAYADLILNNGLLGF